jgi:hypothetical protein
MASRTVTVRPSGGDYTTLAAAVSGEISANADLTTDNGSGSAGPLIIEVQGTWSTDDTSAVTISGFTTSSANYLEIRADSSNNAVKDGWDTGRYRLVVAGTAITNEDAYVRITGLQIKATGTFALNLAYWDSPTPNDIRVDSCRIRGNGTTNDVVGCYAYDGGSSPVVSYTNTIIEDCDQGIKQSDGSLSIYNTIIYGRNSTDHGLYVFSDMQSLVIKNSVIFNCNDDYFEDGGAPSSVTFDYCATDDGEGTNSVSPSGGSWTNEFSDPANGDFTLLNTGNLYDAGVGPSTDASVPVADIDGDSRSGSTCDIGVDEYTSSEDALTGDDISTGVVTVETPSIGQTHALVRTDIATGAVVVETGDLGQVHGLTGDDISTGIVVVGTPTAGEVINGTVEYNGSPCDGATIDVIDDSTDTLTTTTTANGSGEYTLTLSAGTYRVAWTWYDTGESEWRGKAAVITYGS